MKILTAIAIAQFAAILLLYSKIVDLEDRLKHSLVTEQNSTSSGYALRALASADTSGPNAYAEEDRLRQIIREELAAQFGRQPRPAAMGDHVAEAGQRDPVELEWQREQVFERLEYYSSVGKISDAEMQQLQIDIAKLSSADRSAALRELSRAINSGRLEGRL